MDEYIEIVNENGESTGKIALKNEAHRKGWFHNTIHLWLFNSKGEILLSQRSHKKTIYPLLWDVSAAGHVDAREGITEAAVRETHEELGLTIDPERLVPIGVHKHMSTYANGTIKDYEFHHAFIYELLQPIDSLRIDPEEVEAIKMVNFFTFESLLKDSENNMHFIASNSDYYGFVLSEVRKAINN